MSVWMFYILLALAFVMFIGFPWYFKQKKRGEINE